MKLLVAKLFLADAYGEAFFGALRIGAATDERLKAARAKIQTLAFDVAALQEKRRPAVASLSEYGDSTLLELARQKDAETSAYEVLVTRLFLEHRAPAAPGPTSLAPAPLVSDAEPGATSFFSLDDEGESSLESEEFFDAFEADTAEATEMGGEAAWLAAEATSAGALGASPLGPFLAVGSVISVELGGAYVLNEHGL